MTSSLVGGGPSAAQSRRGPSEPSAAMSNALMRLPNDSLMTSVEPSGVIAEPFGNNSGSLATDTVPSGSIRASGVGHERLAGHQVEAEVAGVGDAADGATTMSLTCPVGDGAQVGVLDELAGLLLAQDLAVAASTRRASGRRATSRARTAAAARVTTSCGSLPGHDRHHPVRVEVGEVQRAVAPPRALRERHPVDHRRQLRELVPSPATPLRPSRPPGIGGARTRPSLARRIGRLRRRRLASRGDRGPEVGRRHRPGEAAPHHAGGVGDDEQRDAVDAVALVEVLAAPATRRRSTATSSLASTSALATTSAHVWHVADVNTATSHGASGRSKSARSSCAGTAPRRLRRRIGPAAPGDHGDDDGDDDDGGGDEDAVHVAASDHRDGPRRRAALGAGLPRQRPLDEHRRRRQHDELGVDRATGR